MIAQANAKNREDLMDLRRRGEVSAIDDDDQPSEIVKIRSLAERVFGEKTKADAWLYRPNPSMSGQIPFNLLRDELGRAVLHETLEQIDNGIFA